jgi:hypothetical protein
MAIELLTKTERESANDSENELSIIGFLFVVAFLNECKYFWLLILTMINGLDLHSLTISEQSKCLALSGMFARRVVLRGRTQPNS